MSSSVRTILQRAFGAFAAVTLLAASPAALAVTKPLPQKGFHCLNDQKQELKGARNARECKAPYKWVQAQNPGAKAKAKTVAQAKPKKKIAKATKTTP